jgi:predicted ArsR family transcriptional regulator
MSITRWNQRFFETTKGRILALLRRGSRTVDDLAVALGVTDNAVRTHLTDLERDGIVQQRGVRATGGKPAYAYEVAPEAERLFTKAYIPVLTQLVGVMEERMTAADLEAVFREVGKRLATAKGASLGTLRSRAELAATVLTELGGIVDVEEKDGTLMLRGFSCPLADAVRTHPAMCQAVESLVAELVGGPVQERCDRGARPRCCFELLSKRAILPQASGPTS